MPPFVESDASFDEAFVPSWGLRTGDSVFSDPQIAKDWHVKGISTFDRSQMDALSLDTIISKGIQSAAMVCLKTLLLSYFPLH